MTIQSSTVNAFSVAPGQGRLPKPLNILGHNDIFVRLANSDTNGAVAIFQHPVPPMVGPPMHRHSREDEWFYVLDGEITVEGDGERMVLPVAVRPLRLGAPRTRLKTSATPKRRSW